MKKLIALILCALLVALCAAACADVVSTTPLVREVFWGYRVYGVAVEYDHVIDAQEFAADTFAATDTWETGKPETAQVFMDREISRIYTNSEAAFLTEGAADGNYVIVEFGEDGYAGVRPGDFPQRGYNYDEKTGKTETPRISKPNVGTIQQLAEITAKDGTVLAATEVLGMTNDYIYPEEFYHFELLNIDVPNRATPYNAYIHMPHNYEEGKKYPVIFCITGGGQLQFINDKFNNTDIVLTNDHQLYAWTETRDYDFDYDLIVVSLRQKNTSASIAIEGEDTYEETAAAAKYIIENYPIDTNNLFWCGQSQGSVTCMNVISRHPELCTGYFGTNGTINASMDFADPNYKELPGWVENEKALNTFVDNNIKVCFTFGEADGNSANAYCANVYYKELHTLWAAKGLSEREIDNMMKIRVFPSSTYRIAEGLTDHNVCRVMYWLDATKIDAMKVVEGWIK